MEFDDADIDAFVDELGQQILYMFTNDLYNAVVNNINEMNLIGVNGQLLIQVMMDYDLGEVYSNAEWSGYVEFGTPGQKTVPQDPFAGTELAGPSMSPGRRGPPPLSAIEPWVKAKGIVKTKSGKPSKSKSKIDETARQIAWHIYWHGTKPHPFFRNAIDSVCSDWEDTTIIIEVSA